MTSLTLQSATLNGPSKEVSRSVEMRLIVSLDLLSSY